MAFNSEKQIKESLLLEPDPAILVNGLRDTGYDFNTALADIVDNSIDAVAENIEVSIILKNDNTPLVMIADDGIGMNQSELLDGMKYGSKNTIKPPCRLGKFGLGLKTASTSYCKRLSMISRKSSSDPYYMATWDLDTIARDNKWVIELCGESNIPQFYLKFLNRVASSGHGTLVVWEKIDRMWDIGKCENPGKRIKEYVKNFKQHASMIYHRFLDEKYYPEVRKIKMVLNNERIEAWDPYCQDESNTLILQKDEIPAIAIDEQGGQTEFTFSLRAFLLPHVKTFDHLNAKEAKEKARLTNKNMGFYVYRENRMISYGTWLGLKQQEPHDTLCRIEFTFDHNLDSAFKIDVKKSTIKLVPDLADTLKKWITPLAKESRERYDNATLKTVKDECKNIHLTSDRNIQDKEEAAIRSEITLAEPINNETGTEHVIIKNPGVPEGIKHIFILPPPASNGVTIIPVDSLPGDALWEGTLNNGHHAVMLNQSHDFYKKVYYPASKEKDSVIEGINSLLWALAESENSVQNDLYREAYKTYRKNVSEILTTLVRDLPDPED